MLCLYCGCGRSGAEPACFQGASGSYSAWSAMPSLKLVTNLICTLLASGAFCRVQNAVIVCRGVSLEDHNQAQYRISNWKKGGGGSRADADNVCSDQAKRAGALTRDHQDELCSLNASLSQGQARSVLLPPWPQPQAQTISMTQTTKPCSC